MDDFETAVIYSFDPLIGDDLKQKALALTNSVKESPDGWKYCTEKLFQTKSIHVKFFCFHVFQDLLLHKYAQLNDDDKFKLKSTLINYLKMVLAVQNEEAAVKNKYAQIVVLLFKQEYPENWSSFFQEFLSLLSNGPNLIDIFLRVLKAIDEEVVSYDVHRSTAELAHNTFIKDTMRDSAIKDIVLSWYEILVHYHQSNPQLANMTLQNIKYYVGWIDINLIVNDKFIPLFFKLLNNKALREEACDCFKEIVNKGMDSSAKLSLIKQLQITEIVNVVALDDLDFIIRVGSLVNLTGMEVLRGLESVSQSQDKKFEGGDQLLEQMLALLLKFMNNEHNDVSVSVMNFSALYITKIIRNKMKYSADFDFKNIDGEEEQQFTEFRKDLSTQFRNIFRICPEMVGSFVHNILTNIVQDPSKYFFTDIEVAIYLLFQMGEGISATPEDTMKSFERFFGAMVVLLSSSKIVENELHQIVALIYFETVVRYAKYIPADAQQLNSILMTFLDIRGVHNRNPVVRSRAGYLLNKLVKQLKVQLFPFINKIIESLKNHLIISYEIQKEVPFDEQLNFYESLGVLIGGASLSPQEEQNYVEKILTSPYQKMEEIITKALYKSDTKENPFYTTQLVQLISVIGTFSKGFTPVNNSTGTLKPEPHSYKIYFTKSLLLIIQLPNLIQQNEEIKSRTFFYMHRMVDCLGVDLKPMLPEILPTILSYANNIPTLIEFIMILNNSLSSTFTSPKNINIFEQILSTIIAGCTLSNEGIQKTSFSIIRRLIEEYGQGGNKPVEGFVKFIYNQILPICLQAPLQPQFNIADVASNQVLMEIAKSLKLIAQKYGDEFINYVGSAFLPSIQIQSTEIIQRFTQLLLPTAPLKDFQELFCKSGKPLQEEIVPYNLLEKKNQKMNNQNHQNKKQKLGNENYIYQYDISPDNNDRKDPVPKNNFNLDYNSYMEHMFKNVKEMEYIQKLEEEIEQMKIKEKEYLYLLEESRNQYKLKKEKSQILKSIIKYIENLSQEQY
ncbi:armadillo-like helical domain-containing protein [Heterostelium album PN500]|uniref:Exportin-T n=1 Tax=Heterostelium pallidum (strain ATCC 26659 / Pp 5 / PN500) TaxID=670386 RepID=D3B6B2_HETP5|nr:armadillo-like helical domain-containing protein [Heterostelium album PN500]EFA82882.1 armadillo-like helical domain-containing protein [Heterostelium album PN500]|eukprot:XP_020434999.1 armadillo-like helical domain-containing protein [Heterostelium album PN500]